MKQGVSQQAKLHFSGRQNVGENPCLSGASVSSVCENIRYQYDNHLGSACLELDDTGQIISYEEYHPFGTTSYRAGRSATEVSLKRYKYCGKEQDEETGLYYYGMRYYAAWLCRFVSVDPLQFKYPHYTPYQYAGNKPVSFIDLDGGEETEPETIESCDPNISKIRFLGSQENITSFKNMLNARTGNVYDVTEDNYLKLVENNNKGVSNSEISSDLANLVNDLIANETELSLIMLRDSTKAMFDDFDHAFVDVGDLEKIGSVLQAAFIGHFLKEYSSVENYNNPANRTDSAYKENHEKGVIMESVIANAMLGQQYSLVKDSEERKDQKTDFSVFQNGEIITQSRTTSAYNLISRQYGETTLTYKQPYTTAEIDYQYQNLDTKWHKKWETPYGKIRLLINVTTKLYPTNNVLP
jgi:RHS repeat-associated protein